MFLSCLCLCGGVIKIGFFIFDDAFDGGCMSIALLVIDVQEGIFGALKAPYDGLQVIHRINVLSSRARSVDVPVIFMQHECEGSPLQRGSEKWRLHCDLLIESSDLMLSKNTPDVFLETDLALHLKRLQVRELVICGYATEFCVDFAVRRALGEGFLVTLVSDAHTTHDKAHAFAVSIIEHHNITLANLPMVGCIKVKESSDILFGKV
jgi:nicotinamidase-related amidase